MELRYSLSAEDIRVAQVVADGACRAELKRPLWEKALLVLVGISGGLSVAAALGMYQKYPGTIAYDFSWVVLPMLLALVGIFIFVHLARRALARERIAQLEPFPIEQNLLITDEGLRFENRNGTCFLPWGVIKSTQVLPNYLAITSLQWVTFVIPVSAFASAEQRTELKNLIERHIASEPT